MMTPPERSNVQVAGFLFHVTTNTTTTTRKRTTTATTLLLPPIVEPTTTTTGGNCIRIMGFRWFMVQQHGGTPPPPGVVVKDDKASGNLYVEVPTSSLRILRHLLSPILKTHTLPLVIPVEVVNERLETTALGDHVLDFPVTSDLIRLHRMATTTTTHEEEEEEEVAVVAKEEDGGGGGGGISAFILCQNWHLPFQATPSLVVLLATEDDAAVSPPPLFIRVLGFLSYDGDWFSEEVRQWLLFQSNSSPPSAAMVVAVISMATTALPDAEELCTIRTKASVSNGLPVLVVYGLYRPAVF
jgi:hypothetical protein